MSALVLDVRDAGPLEVEDEVIAFEDELDADLSPQACLKDPYLTYTPTHILHCWANS